MEDDIIRGDRGAAGSADRPGVSPPCNRSLKFVHNCEYRLFQRPDDAVHRGYDHQTESDFARPARFSPTMSRSRRPSAGADRGRHRFDEFTAPMQELIKTAAAGGRPEFFVSCAHPRLVDGILSKTSALSADAADLLNLRESHVAEVGLRLMRRVPVGRPVPPRSAPSSPGGGTIRPTRPPASAAGRLQSAALHGTAELFMEFICSMTGKSPSTTGAGSEAH